MRFFGDYWQNFGELIGRSAAAGGGVAAPVIATDAVIGTELDAGAGYDAYQWQSSSDGSTWADISGATAQTYTPDDAVFGLYLRVKGDGAASNATNRVAEVPAQSLGANVVTDGDFEAADTSAFATSSGGTLSKQAGARTGGSGARIMRITTPAADVISGALQVCLTSGTWYSLHTWWRSDGTGRLSIGTGSLNNILIPTGAAPGAGTWLEHRVLYRATATDFQFGNFPASTAAENYIEVDDLVNQPVALNTQLVAPSADMRLTAFYTLPASPVAGDQVWVTPRVPEGEDFFVNGNGWLVLLEYTGSQWNITAYTVASHSRVSRITASNIGATNGIRVTMNGTSIALETTADGGDNWTPRGTPATNATYQTAKGVNMAHTSAVTPVTLEYEPAV